MPILGISASGRPNGITGEVVKAVMEASGEPYEYVTLAGRKINGCAGCTRCGADNHCRVEDDWIEIGDKMLAADAIVFGAPNYFHYVNALAHACWERTFCFRHREVFLLAGKLGIAVAVDGGEEDSRVLEYIRYMMGRNKMVVVDSVYADGYSQCYTCGFGEDCAVGEVVKQHGFLDRIDAQQLPPRLKGQDTASFQAYRAGKTIGSILRARRENAGT